MLLSYIFVWRKHQKIWYFRETETYKNMIISALSQIFVRRKFFFSCSDFTVHNLKFEATCTLFWKALQYFCGVSRWITASLALHLLFPLCTQSRKNFSILRTRHLNVPVYDWFRQPASYFTGRIKMSLLILPVLCKFYRQNKQSDI